MAQSAESEATPSDDPVRPVVSGKTYPASPLSADRAAALRELLTVRSGERHVVAIQDFPDPDAISSGLAYREIARTFEITADILYEGLISHPENLALVNLLDIELIRFADDTPLDHYDAAFIQDPDMI